MSDYSPRASGTTDPGDRSAAEIERDVERTRARLTGTVEELKDRVSPSQLADQAMDWLRGSGGRQFVNNLGATLRDNPMPVLLVAAGIGWMALSGGRAGASERPSRRWSDGERDDGTYAGGVYGGADYATGYAGESYPPETYAGQGLHDEAGGPSLGERASEAAGGVRDKAGDLANRAAGAASSAMQGATGAARSVADSVASGSRQASRRAGEALHGAADRAAYLGDRAYRYGAGAGRSVTETLESQPLLLGAIGFSVGAALGALVPHSAAEDRLMGESRDRVADRLSALAGEAYAKARDVAGEQAARAQQNLGEAYGEARDRVAGSGVSASEGASALGGVARDLRQAVERTAQDAAQSVREATAKPGEPDPTQPGGRPAGGSATGMPPAKSGPEGGGPV